MVKITLEVTNDQAQLWAFFLRKRYKKTTHNLNKLVELAILKEVEASAHEILDDTVKRLDNGERV